MVKKRSSKRRNDSGNRNVIILVVVVVLLLVVGLKVGITGNAIKNCDRDECRMDCYSIVDGSSQEDCLSDCDKCGSEVTGDTFEEAAGSFGLLGEVFSWAARFFSDGGLTAPDGEFCVGHSDCTSGFCDSTSLCSTPECSVTPDCGEGYTCTADRRCEAIVDGTTPGDGTDDECDGNVGGACTDDNDDAGVCDSAGYCISGYDTECYDGTDYLTEGASCTDSNGDSGYCNYGICAIASCGNGICEFGEVGHSSSVGPGVVLCTSDCSSGCGRIIGGRTEPACTSSEESSCPNDCGVCGDDICQDYEDEDASCPDDCGDDTTTTPPVDNDDTNLERCDVDTSACDDNAVYQYCGGIFCEICELSSEAGCEGMGGGTAMDGQCISTREGAPPGRTDQYICVECTSSRHCGDDTMYRCSGNVCVLR